MTPLEKTTFGSFANHTQNIEAVVQYQFDFGLRPSLGYVYAKGKDLGAKEDTNADIMNYVELGTGTTSTKLQRLHRIQIQSDR